MNSPAADLDAVLALERELQSPATRADPGRLRQLLHPEFVEIGASGRRWDLRTILAMLQEESADPAPITVEDLTGRHLTDDLVQVFWDSDHAGRRARRTSLWQRDEAGWRQVYHQGTPLPAD